VGGHIGCHADRDPRCPVNEQVRDPGGQYGRFFKGIVKIQLVVNRFLVDIGKHFIRNPAHPGFRISHGCRAVAVNRAKVPLAVDQHITQAPFLGHTHHGIIHRSIVRVVLTEYFPDYPGRFLMGTRRTNPQLMHPV